MDEIQRLILIDQLEIMSALKPDDAEDNALKSQLSSMDLRLRFKTM